MVTSICALIRACFSPSLLAQVQKGDLVAGYVNQTAAKTVKKIKEARGGILFVDEAYQLTQALMKGQTDFAGEAIDEMMKVLVAKRQHECRAQNPRPGDVQDSPCNIVLVSGYEQFRPQDHNFCVCRL